jgi:hypothetical protein
VIDAADEIYGDAPNVAARIQAWKIEGRSDRRGNHRDKVSQRPTAAVAYSTTQSASISTSQL